MYSAIAVMSAIPVVDQFRKYIQPATYAREFLGEKGAYVAGWMYFLNWSTTGIADITAIALYTNVVFFVFHLMPIPGLDGAHLLARVLPPRARHTYENLGEYLPLFVLLVFFLLAGPLLGIVQGLSNLVCRVVAGVPC